MSPTPLVKEYFTLNFPSKLRSSKWFFNSRSPSKLYMPFSSLHYVLHAPPFSFIFIWSLEEVLVRNNTDHINPYYVVFSSLLLARPSQVQISTLTPHALFSNILSLCTSLNVRNKVWIPRKTTSKIKVLYILNFIFLNSKLKTDDFVAKNSKHSLSSTVFIFFTDAIFACYSTSLTFEVFCYWRINYLSPCFFIVTDTKLAL
jgi:hypothetical protein